MVWDENKKGWMLRKLKKRDSALPPIIEATKSDAYEVIINKIFRMFLERRKLSMN